MRSRLKRLETIIAGQPLPKVDVVELLHFVSNDDLDFLQDMREAIDKSGPDVLTDEQNERVSEILSRAAEAMAAAQKPRAGRTAKHR